MEATDVVRVTDPVSVKGDAMIKHHFTYQVTGADGATKYSCRRRYRQFRWLQKILRKNNPTAIVPPIPPKSGGKEYIAGVLTGSAGACWLRVRAFERFLHRVIAHPSLRHDSRLEEFFSASDAEADASMSEGAVPDPGPAGSASTWDSEPTTNENVLFRKLVKQTEVAKTVLGQLHATSERLVSETASLRQHTKQAGQSVKVAAAILQSVDPGLSDRLDTTFTKVADAYGTQIWIQTAALAERVHEYARWAIEVDNVLGHRNVLNKTLHDALRQYEAALTASKQLQGAAGDGAKLAEAEAKSASLAAKVHECKAAYETGAQRVVDELTRWLQVAFEDIKAFSLDLAELLRANEAATASVWGDATDSPGGGGAAPAVDGDVFA